MQSWSRLEFAPLNVPLHRRLQTAAVAAALSIAPVSIALFLFLTLRRRSRLLSAAYVAFLIADRRTPKRGGRPIAWLRELSLWRHFADYFPSRLVKTVDYDPNQKYLFAAHPHGILAMGIWCSVLTEARQFSKVFPGIDVRVLTISQNFLLPFWRDFLLGVGLVDASRESCDNLFNNGKAMLVLVGGAAEALYSRPAQDDLAVNRRKGFIRLAMIHGANLVPVFTFGETDLYDQVPNPQGSKIRYMQDSLKRVFGYSMPLILGRGIYNYSFGVLPQRRPITTVFGPPLKVEQNPNPTGEEIEMVQQEYIKALTDLFNKYKEEYGYDEHVLRIVE